MFSYPFYTAEMVRRQALFPGDSELQQLLHIFRFFFLLLLVKTYRLIVLKLSCKNSVSVVTYNFMLVVAIIWKCNKVCWKLRCLDFVKQLHPMQWLKTYGLNYYQYIIWKFFVLPISSINLYCTCIEPLTKTAYDKAVGNSYWGELAWSDSSEGLAWVSRVEITEFDSCSPDTGTGRGRPANGKLKCWSEMLTLYQKIIFLSPVCCSTFFICLSCFFNSSNSSYACPSMSSYFLRCDIVPYFNSTDSFWFTSV
jgi:hypothetical protein